MEIVLNCEIVQTPIQRTEKTVWNIENVAGKKLCSTNREIISKINNLWIIKSSLLSPESVLKDNSHNKQPTDVMFVSYGKNDVWKQHKHKQITPNVVEHWTCCADS